MPKVLILLLLLLSCRVACAASSPDPYKKGSLSHLLSYSLIYQAPANRSGASFVTTLTNISKQNLNVLVDPKQFHATLKVLPEKGEPFTAYEKDYRNLILTSLWIEPEVRLAPNQSIIWTVPIQNLLTLHGEQVTPQSLQGSCVVSELNVAVIPPAGGFADKNAFQTSPAIQIPKAAE